MKENEKSSASKCPHLSQLLLKAAETGSAKLIDLLIEKGADINTSSNANISPLHFAIRNKHTEVAKLLIQKYGADVNRAILACGNRLITPLHEVAKSGDKELAQLLIQKGAVVNAGNPCSSKIHGDSSFTPLHAAISEGQDAVAQLLIENGANIHAFDTHLRTSLHYAAENGRLKMAELLMRKGACVDAKDCCKVTPLHLSLQCGHEELAEILIKKGANVNARSATIIGTPLLGAVQLQSTKLVKRLIQKGANVNAEVGQQGLTALEQATTFNHVDLAELLIQNGAKVNCKNMHGMTPLHHASSRLIAADNDQWSKLDMVKFLIEKGGASINTRNRDKMTPLHFAAMFKEFEMMEYLLSKGADVNAKDCNGRNPLLWAIFLTFQDKEDAELCGKNHRESETGVQMLILKKAKLFCNYGADLNAHDSCMRTALHYVAQMGDQELAEELICNGADVNAQDSLKRKPHHIAALKGFKDLAKFFIKKGAVLISQEPPDSGLSESLQKFLILEEQLKPCFKPVIQERLLDCAICFDPEQGKYAFQPCRHAQACEKCCQTVLGMVCPCCPICGDEISQCQRIHYTQGF